MSVLASIFGQFQSFGFSGSRSCPVAVAAAQSVFELLPVGSSVSVGCAAGVDASVRAAFPAASVFSVAEFGGSILGRAAFAARSAAMVQAVGSAGGLLLVFPSSECPAGVAASRQFRGLGSGSWGSAALAVGLGFPVLVCIPAGCSAPGWLRAAGVQLAGSSFWFVRPALSLF